MHVYAIEYINGGGKLTTTRYAADTAGTAVREFERDHPGCELTELRRVHVGERQ
jgi:hypothetical protein